MNCTANMLLQIIGAHRSSRSLPAIAVVIPMVASLPLPALTLPTLPLSLAIPFPLSFAVSAIPIVMIPIGAVTVVVETAAAKIAAVGARWRKPG